MPSAVSPLEALPALVPQHFQDAQHSLATHRKNVVALQRAHAAAAQVTQRTERGTKLVGEKAFNEVFIACLNRVLGIKKGVVNADRIVKFVAAYASYAQGAFRAAARAASGEEPASDDEEEDTAATRFVSILLKHLLRGFGAKNKAVRLRCCQAVALLINGLEAMDDDLYQTLKGALLMRARDKESSVRVQAIVALAKLQGGEDEEDLDEPEGSGSDGGTGKDVTGVLLRILREDPSAEARRAALFNLTPTARTLPFILERLRDVDAINRRCVYLGSLSHTMLAQPGAAALEVHEWGDVVKTGLSEREESVRRAARKLVCGWVDRDADLEKFAARFDIVNNPEIAASALRAIFEARPALLDAVSFDESFWANLTPGTAFVGRQFVEHCRSLGPQGATRLDEAMPLVTALAFRTQAVWGTLLELLETELEADAEAELSPQAEGARSTLDSLLHIAMSADYGDEIGRRKMFGLVRDMISNTLFPHALLDGALDVLLKLSAGQRDFMQIVVELVQEMGDWEREGERDEQSEEDEEEDEAEVEDALATGRTGRRKRGAASPDEDELARQAGIDARRLAIVRGMLERMSGGGIQEMMGLVSQLISPAMRSKDEAVREQGFLCMGLCSILDADVAATTFPMFLNHLQRSSGIIKVRALQVTFDMLTVHGISRLSAAQVEGLGGGPEAEAKAHEHLVTFLLSLLEDEDEELRVQSAAAQGMAKLMLAGIVEDDVALRSLVLIYMTPETSGNQELRQCLGYFLPVYCFSSPHNQRKLQRVLVETLHILAELYYELEDGQEMVTPLQVGLQLLDWTDPSKSIRQDGDQTIHADVAMDLMKQLLLLDDKDERKVLCQLLTKLNLPEPEALSADRAEALFLLARVLKATNPLDDTVTRNAFARFEAAAAKRYPEAAAAAEEHDLADASGDAVEELRAWFEEVQLEIRGAKAGQATAAAAKSRGKAKPQPKAAPAPPKKKSIKLMSDDEDDSDDAPSAAPTQDEDESMDDEEELSDDELA